MATPETNDNSPVLQVTAKDLPVACPRGDSPLWARHPRVYLDVLESGEAVCPYCSTRYVFSGERPSGHH